MTGLKIFLVVWWVVTVAAAVDTFIGYVLDPHHIHLIDNFAIGWTVGTALSLGFLHFVRYFSSLR